MIFTGFDWERLRRRCACPRSKNYSEKETDEKTFHVWEYRTRPATGTFARRIEPLPESLMYMWSFK